MDKIGKLIKQKRLEHGLTLQDIGNFVGVSKSTVHKWETGDIQAIRRDKISLLAKILKVPPIDLMDLNFEEDQNVLEFEQLENAITDLFEDNGFKVRLHERGKPFPASESYSIKSKDRTEIRHFIDLVPRYIRLTEPKYIIDSLLSDSHEEVYEKPLSKIESELILKFREFDEQGKEQAAAFIRELWELTVNIPKIIEDPLEANNALMGYLDQMSDDQVAELLKYAEDLQDKSNGKSQAPTSGEL